MVRSVEDSPFNVSCLARNRCQHLYNNDRLHSAIGYVAPKDKLEGREVSIFDERKRKLEQARQRREAHFQSIKDTIADTIDITGEIDYVSTVG